MLRKFPRKPFFYEPHLNPDVIDVNNKKIQQQILLKLRSITNYISFLQQIAYKLIEEGRSEDILQVHSLSVDGLNDNKDTIIQWIE